MNAEREIVTSKARAGEIADQLVSLYANETLKVEPEAIARRLGCDVQSLNPFDLSNSGLSGKFEVVDGVPSLFFNSTESLNRRRFTLAHELGHFVLNHGSSCRDPSKNYSLANFEPREVAANHFAACLLMPKSRLRYLIHEAGITDVTLLSDALGVSEAALSYRLKNLGIA